MSITPLMPVYPRCRGDLRTDTCDPDRVRRPEWRQAPRCRWRYARRRSLPVGPCRRLPSRASHTTAHEGEREFGPVTDRMHHVRFGSPIGDDEVAESQLWVPVSPFYKIGRESCGARVGPYV